MSWVTQDIPAVPAVNFYFFRPELPDDAGNGVAGPLIPAMLTRPRTPSPGAWHLGLEGYRGLSYLYEGLSLGGVIWVGSFVPSS